MPKSRRKRAMLALGLLPTFVVACVSTVTGSSEPGDDGGGPAGDDASLDAASSVESAPDARDSAALDAPVDAALEAEPCPPGSLLVFVSSKQYDGDLGLRTGGDTRCKALADSAGIDASATWRAWLSSDGVDAIDLLPEAGTWCLVDGALAVTRGDLEKGSLPHPINVQEDGKFAVESSGPTSAWTGTLANGRNAGENCGNWTKRGLATVGVRGNYASTTTEWTHWPPSMLVTAVTCNNVNRLYCFQTE